jgi:hypothetical protein
MSGQKLVWPNLTTRTERSDAAKVLERRDRAVIC